MTHYTDIWYSSMSAQIRGKKRPRAERESGLPQVDKTDPGKKEQISAMEESLTATIEQILIDMQKTNPQPNEHIRVEGVPAGTGERALYKQASSKKGFNADLYVNKRRKALKNIAAGPGGIYEAWGSKVNKAGEITGTGLELGFAFEKAAYGFYSPQQKKGEWAVGFHDKFEKKYCKYLQ
jgi:hypothetical protein